MAAKSRKKAASRRATKRITFCARSPAAAAKQMAEIVQAGGPGSSFSARFFKRAGTPTFSACVEMRITRQSRSISKKRFL